MEEFWGCHFWQGKLWFFCEIIKKPPYFCQKNVRNSEGIFFDSQEVKHIKDKIPVMDYSQYRRARKLVHACCNYDNGNCIILDDGEECVCVQSISYSLLCRWFRIAVLPLDKPLKTVLLYRGSMKRCVVCGQPFLPGSNRAKYCKPCAAKVHRKQKNASDHKRRLLCGQLGAKKPWYSWTFQLLSAGWQYKSLPHPKSRLETVRRGNFTYPGFSRLGKYLLLLYFMHFRVRSQTGLSCLGISETGKAAHLHCPKAVFPAVDISTLWRAGE